MTFVDDDDAYEYGSWITHDIESALKEDRESYWKRASDPYEIWPNWMNGVPTKLRRALSTPEFSSNGILHKRYTSYFFREYDWHSPKLVASLRRDYGLLPSTFSSEWSGVYRIFAAGTTIERSCGGDPTGTLYIGMAGAGKWRSSSLRSRIKAIATDNHHAIGRWTYSDIVRARFPAESLFVEWACIGLVKNFDGKMIPGTLLAESFLLWCYQNSFGEYPPWNEKG